MKVILGPDPIEHIDRDGGHSRYVWLCSVCGLNARWRDGWRTYSSYADEEMGEIPFVVCSDHCAGTKRAKLLRRASEMLGKRPLGRSGAGHYPDHKVNSAIAFIREMK